MNSTQQNIAITEEYAHGDPDAGAQGNKQGEYDASKEPLSAEGSLQAPCNSVHKLGFKTKESPEEDVNVNSESSFSIQQLYDDSAKLLSVVEEPAGTINNLTNTATIFDLRIADRKRVGEMVSQLASTTQRLETLEHDFEILSRKEAKYKDKSSQLMKKVDVLNEKCERLEDEKIQMKDKHYESLTTLHKSVSTVSDQFELSVKETQLLRESNALLQSENKRLRGKLSTLENRIILLEKTNQKIIFSQEIENQSPTKSVKYKCFQNSSCSDVTSPQQDTKFIPTPPPTAEEEKILHELFFRF